MTLKQRIVKLLYPFLMKPKDKGKILTNSKDISPLQSFYSLNAVKNNNEIVNFDTLKGKKVLLVNTASNCGYTPQYGELEKLYETHKNKLVILGFPANDFKEQEKGSNEEIAEFCKINYGVSFPIMKKSSVIKSSAQNEVFKWLSNKDKNGWNNMQPTWNFSKYLVDENGVLVNFFGPSVSPLNDIVLRGIKEIN